MSKDVLWQRLAGLCIAAIVRPGVGVTEMSFFSIAYYPNGSGMKLAMHGAAVGGRSLSVYRIGHGPAFRPIPGDKELTQ